MINFTDGERAHWIQFCESIAYEFGIAHEDFNQLTDEELDKEADWFFYLTRK